MSTEARLLVTHPIADEALLESLPELARPQGRDLLRRTAPYLDWQQRRCRAGLCPYPNSPQHSPECTIRFRERRPSQADLDFASGDALGLAAAARPGQAAAQSLRPDGEGVPVHMARRLALAIAEWLGHPHVALFESGVDARVRSIAALVGRRDYVLVDRCADPTTALVARNATGNVLLYDHLDLDEVRAQLCELRGRAATQAILVVTQGLFPLESDAPDLPQLQAICREYGARLLVDSCHDLGVRGPDGTGQIGIQGMLGEIDLVLGCFSTALVSNVGFLATGSREAAEFVLYRAGAHTATHTPSALQCALACDALRICRSEEGAALRHRIETAVGLLRDEFAGRGVRCLGDPTPSVVVHLGWEGGARLVGALVLERGLFADVLEYPVVPPGGARLALRVRADATPDGCRRAAQIVAESVRRAWEIVARS